MTWAMLNAIAVWACAVSAVTCSISIVWLINVNRRAHVMTIAALNGLGETHMLGFKALTIELNQLKARVAELEQRPIILS